MLAKIEIQNMFKFTNSLHEKFGEVLEYGQADGVVDSLVRLVLQRYDPDGVTEQSDPSMNSGRKVKSRRVGINSESAETPLCFSSLSAGLHPYRRVSTCMPKNTVRENNAS